MDWNVMSQLKGGSHQELKEILSNKNRFLILFSTAHIGDILSSFDDSEKQQKYIDSDLEYISTMTDDRCIFIEGENVLVDYYAPRELFEQRISSRYLLSNLATKGLLSIFEGYDIPQEVLNSFNDIMKSGSINSILTGTLNDPKKNEQIEKFFPGLKENPTFEGMITGVIRMIQGLNENESYKDLRRTVQSGLNIKRDKIFDSKAPFELIDKAYEKAGIERSDRLKNSKQGPGWYNEICDEYIQLDMHGYQEDNVNTRKGRKETFKNTTEDAFHCAFATGCNFYITNDDKAYKKSKKIYEKLGLQTVVMKPHEFVKYFKDYLDFENDIDTIHLINEVIKNFKFYEEDMTDSKLRIYPIPYFLFDFFNKIMVIVNNDGQIDSIILSRNNPTHNFIFSIEISKLISKLIVNFGIDQETIGELNELELKDEEWKERVWMQENARLTLRRLNGHFQLYFTF